MGDGRFPARTRHADHRQSGKLSEPRRAHLHWDTRFLCFRDICRVERHPCCLQYEIAVAEVFKAVLPEHVRYPGKFREAREGFRELLFGLQIGHDEIRSLASEETDIAQTPAKEAEAHHGYSLPLEGCADVHPLIVSLAARGLYCRL